VAKNRKLWKPHLLARTEEMEARYSNPDNDSRGPWKSGDLSARNYYSEGTYSIICPSGRVIDGPPPGTYWRYSKQNFKELDRDGRIWWGKEGNNVPAIKRFLSEVKEGRVPQTLWFYGDVGHTQDAKKTLLEMGLLKADEKTITAKPVSLIERVLEIGANDIALVLDSFAGSGTTAHAVLKANKRDGGNRRFILVEMEDYADRLTAERVRRAINGYAFQGTQRTELLREKITWSALKRADTLVQKVEGIENLHSHEYDRIKKEIDGELIVTGEKTVDERAEGLGGAFTYCTLGDPVELDKVLTGESLPSFASIGAALFHMATNRALDPATTHARAKQKEFYLGEADGRHVWLIYKPDLDWLKTPEAALTLARAKAFARDRSEEAALGFCSGALCQSEDAGGTEPAG
jgi:adenine-specific DNA-methyltransferase